MKACRGLARNWTESWRKLTGSEPWQVACWLWGVYIPSFLHRARFSTEKSTQYPWLSFVKRVPRECCRPRPSMGCRWHGAHGVVNGMCLKRGKRVKRRRGRARILSRERSSEEKVPRGVPESAPRGTKSSLGRSRDIFLARLSAARGDLDAAAFQGRRPVNLRWGHWARSFSGGGISSAQS